MLLRRVVAALMCLALAAFVVMSAAFAALRGKFFDLYVHRLDGWVEGGADPRTVQAVVVESCGRLVLTQAGWFERVELMTVYRDEFDFRVDVCTKMTVNRVYKQPEFEKPELVQMICRDTSPYHELFVRLCEHDGLRP